MSDPNKPDNSGAVVAAVLGGLALVGGAVAVAVSGGKKQSTVAGAASGGFGSRRPVKAGKFAKGCGCGGR